MVRVLRHKCNRLSNNIRGLIVLILLLVILVIMYNAPVIQYQNKEDVTQALSYLADKECEIRDYHRMWRYVKQPHSQTDKNIQVTHHGFPKIIHHIFGFWDSKLKEDWKRNLDSCRANTPGYIHILWNKTMAVDFIKTHYSWFMKTFSSYEYEVQRTDAARYFIIYHFGGIYMDMDIRCSKNWLNIHDIIPQTTELTLVSGDPFGVTNYFLLAKPCNTFLKYMVSRMDFDHHWFVITYPSVMFTTGPTYMSWKLDAYKSIQKTYAAKDAVYIIPLETFWTRYFIRIGNHGAGTWHGWEGPICIFLYDHYMATIVLAVMFIIILVIFRHNRRRSPSLLQY